VAFLGYTPQEQTLPANIYMVMRKNYISDFDREVKKLVEKKKV